MNLLPGPVSPSGSDLRRGGTVSHSVGDILLASGATLILLDLVVATSTGRRSTLVRLRLERTFPHLSAGLAVVLVCAIGTAVISLGLHLLTRPP